MTKTNKVSYKAKRLASALLRENRRGRSWRTIARDDYQDRVNFATLNRIATSRGEWLPKDEEILKVLGLVTIRSPYAVMPRWWNRTPDSLRVFRYIGNQAKIIANETRDAQFAYKKKRKP
jgi:hypothetical protein